MPGINIDTAFTLTAPDSDYFAAGVTGGTWALTENDSPLGVAYQVSLENLSATNHSAKTWTIVGELYGVAQTETLSMPGASLTVESANYYSSVTSVTPSATIGADTMNIGYVDEAVSRIFVIDNTISNATLGFIVESGATVNYTGQYTLSKIQDNDEIIFLDVPVDSDIYQETVSNTESFFGKPTALRIKINSFSGTQTDRIQITQ